MFTTLKNAWRIPELRKKLIFTAMVLLIFRLCNAVTVPFVVEGVNSSVESIIRDNILGLYNMMSGGALSQASVLALGIQPYINASIIIQLLTIAIPALERLQKDGGEEGKKKLNTITRFTTIGLGLLMGWAYYMMLSNYGLLASGTGVLEAIVIVLAFAAGASVVMWFGEQITEHGIGNGISMILFVNIVSGLPSLFGNAFNMDAWWHTVLVLLGMAALVVLIVFVNDAERRIPIQYAKRVVGRKVYGGQNTNLPIKVAMTGVMPIIFAQSIATLPATICSFAGWTNNWAYKNVFSSSSWLYAVIYFLLIFFFSWFYASIQYDPVEISNNLKKNGGFIPGFRPGKPTSDFIKKVIAKIVIFGAVYLSVVALLPIVAGNLLPSVQSLAIGGTSIIIVVSVALETVKALEAQMLMRHYKGFLD